MKRKDQNENTVGGYTACAHHTIGTGWDMNKFIGNKKKTKKSMPPQGARIHAVCCRCMHIDSTLNDDVQRTKLQTKSSASKETAAIQRTLELDDPDQIRKKKSHGRAPLATVTEAVDGLRRSSCNVCATIGT
jgi:hypothetical protein